jgi:hypothetical protein
MKRFLMFVGVAAVAAAMYVSASSASQQSGFVRVPAAQFKALRLQVGTLARTVGKLSKNLKQVQALATAEATVLAACDKGAAPIDQFGDGTSATPTEGYEYSPTTSANTSSTFLTTGLDIAPPSDTGAGWFAFGTSSCGQMLNGNGLRHAAAKAGIQLPRAASHLPVFSAHRH